MPACSFSPAEYKCSHPKSIYSSGYIVPGNGQRQQCAPQFSVDAILKNMLIGLIVWKRNTVNKHSEASHQHQLINIIIKLITARMHKSDLIVYQPALWKSATLPFCTTWQQVSYTCRRLYLNIHTHTISHYFLWSRFLLDGFEYTPVVLHQDASILQRSGDFIDNDVNLLHQPIVASTQRDVTFNPVVGEPS